jgi:hypothetical protein
MDNQPLLFEDLLGNMPDLIKTIEEIIKTHPNWSEDWSITLSKSDSLEEIGSVHIRVTVDNKEFLRDLVVFNNTAPLKPKKAVGFSIQWGFVPHPIIPIIHAWLKRVDTSFERTHRRTATIKQELIENTDSPKKYSLNIEGL